MKGKQIHGVRGTHCSLTLIQLGTTAWRHKRVRLSSNELFLTVSVVLFTDSDNVRVRDWLAAPGSTKKDYWSVGWAQMLQNLIRVMGDEFWGYVRKENKSIFLQDENISMRVPNVIQLYTENCAWGEWGSCYFQVRVHLQLKLHLSYFHIARRCYRGLLIHLFQYWNMNQ